jgi:oxysterol-binding protein-related protein 3/6/7
VLPYFSLVIYKCRIHLQDLSNISFPVIFNEPLSLLQRYVLFEDMISDGLSFKSYHLRLAEDMEYSNLLDQAVATTDPVSRMCFIAAFAVSGFACTRMRSGRKSLWVTSNN